MKRLLLTFSCLIYVIWFMPLFAKAYTAPNGNEYTYKVEASTGSQSTIYFTLYSDNKMCTVDGYNYNNGGKLIMGLFPNTDGGKSVCSITHTSGSSISNVGIVYYPSSTVNSGQNFGYYDFKDDSVNPWYGVYYMTNYNVSNDENNLPNFSNMEDALAYLNAPPIDFEELYYDPTIPTPNYVVSMSRPSAWEDVNSETNYFDVTWSDYPDYYIQIGYKYSVPNGMKVALVDGSTNYIPLTYYNSSFYNIYSLEDTHTAQNLNNSVNSTSFVWNADAISDSESWNTSVPIWANNYNNSAYAKARNNWNTKYMYCMPLFGNKLEIFARLFYVADSQVYVGAWKHWNNTYPNEFTEEIPNNYQVGSAIPGYENTSNNTDYQELENTQTTIGNQTGANNTPTVVVNNLTQNYPDYPTVATYNHDNLLLQFFATAKQLPNSFSGFTSFLAASFTWIPSYIWDIIAFGLLASITVMVIKIL